MVWALKQSDYQFNVIGNFALSKVPYSQGTSGTNEQAQQQRSNTWRVRNLTSMPGTLSKSGDIKKPIRNMTHI